MSSRFSIAWVLSIISPTSNLAVRRQRPDVSLGEVLDHPTNPSF
ncbi:hypothetical protein [Massilia phosphatilytica]